MKKFIVFLAVVLVAVWALQTYTSFKAWDYTKIYWAKIDWSYFKNIDLSKLNFWSDKTPNPEKQLNVFIRDGKFLPNMNSAKVGIKVTWYNEDTKAHTVTGEGWGSEEIKPGKAYSKTFNAAGDYKYHCSLYPSMTGELIVQ